MVALLRQVLAACAALLSKSSLIMPTWTYNTPPQDLLRFGQSAGRMAHRASYTCEEIGQEEARSATSINRFPLLLCTMFGLLQEVLAALAVLLPKSPSRQDTEWS